MTFGFGFSTNGVVPIAIGMHLLYIIAPNVLHTLSIFYLRKNTNKVMKVQVQVQQLIYFQ